MFNSLVSAAIEQLLNQLIKLDSDFFVALQALARKQLSVEICDLEYAMTLLFDSQKFIVLPQVNNDADCVISANLDTLLALKQPENVTQLIRTGKLSLEGDLNLAQGYSQAFNQLDIDWADNLSEYVGDGPAFTIVAFIRQVNERALQQISSAKTGLTALLQDEIKVSIHPLEAQLFKQQCRQLQQEIVKLEQRINKLTTLV